MKKIVLTSLLVLLWLAPGVVAAQEKDEYGPFVALMMDRAVVEDVAVEDNDIYVKVAREHWGSEFIVKISNNNMAAYRNWLDGTAEISVKVYRSQKKNKQGYTYRVNTSANFIEYWLEGRLILHMERLR